jgi:hypothetical protein
MFLATHQNNIIRNFINNFAPHLELFLINSANERDFLRLSPKDTVRPDLTPSHLETDLPKSLYVPLPAKKLPEPYAPFKEENREMLVPLSRKLKGKYGDLYDTYTTQASKALDDFNAVAGKPRPVAADFGDFRTFDK